MRSSFWKHARLWAMAAGIGLTSLFTANAHAQLGAPYRGGYHNACPPSPCLSPTLQPQMQPQPLPQPPATQPAPAPATPNVQLPAEQSFVAAGDTISVADSNVGYIDSALIGNQFRLRYDAAYGDRRPDRAEFFYPKCGCFGGNAPGPVRPERSVDFQEFSVYTEAAMSRDWSVFVELPVRFINPEVNDNHEGLGDINAGFKVSLWGDQATAFTFQFRTWFPTGDPDSGLGTDHFTVEPALLLYHRLDERLTFESEFHYYAPIGGTDFAGDVIRYGVGLGYDAYRDCDFKVTPIAELVGWTVLSGQETDLAARGGAVDASGITIVNLKVGVRVTTGSSAVYVGYGHGLTSDRWYDDILRFEYRYSF